MKTVGERLKELRIKQGLSQEEVANILGTSKQTIHKYEKNIIENIPLDRIETMAKLYDTTPSYITGWEIKEEQAEEQPTFNTIAAHSDAPLTKEEMDKVKSYVQFLISQRKNENK